MLKKNAEKQFESELRFIQKSLVLSDKLEELAAFLNQEADKIDESIKRDLIGKRGRSTSGSEFTNEFCEIENVLIDEKDIVIKFKSGYFTGLTYLELE